MRHSRLTRRQLRNHARYRGRNDLNIVPMLDVMVILSFFLIFTAVFSKTSVLEVNLPGPGAPAAATTPTFELEVIVRRGAIEIADRNQGVLETVPACQFDFLFRRPVMDQFTQADFIQTFTVIGLPVGARSTTRAPMSSTSAPTTTTSTRSTHPLESSSGNTRLVV
jgi:hypothetical protein